MFEKSLQDLVKGIRNTKGDRCVAKRTQLRLERYQSANMHATLCRLIHFFKPPPTSSRLLQCGVHPEGHR